VSQSAGIRHIFQGTKTLAILVLGLCEFVRGALLFFILPIYVHGVLGLSTQIVGYAIAAHYILDTGLRSPAGWFADRFGQRKVVLIGQAVGWIGIWVIVRAHHEGSVIIGSAMLGLGMAAVWPATISRVTGGLTKESYATAMGGIMMAWLVGAGGGAVSMSWLLGDHVRSGFVTLLIVWSLSFGLAIVTMQGYRKELHHRTRVHFAHILREVESVRMLFPGMFVQTFAMGLMLPVFVLYARYVLGLSGQMYSYLLVAGGAATVFLQMPMGRLVDKFGYKWFLVPGFVLSATALPVIVRMHSLVHIFIGVFFLGAAYALILPSWNSVLAQSVSEQRRAVMFGVFMTVEGLGMAVGPVVGTELWNAVGPYAPFYAASFILFGMGAFYTVAPLERLFIVGKTDERTEAERL